MPFSPEEISQIINEFFETVGSRQYIGARYVPIFGRKGETSIEWNNSAPYEPLTIVLYQGNSYTSRQFVPTGVDILNQDFWVSTGNYNAQIEQYRQEVVDCVNTVDGFDTRITQNADDILSLEDKIENLEDVETKNTHVTVTQVSVIPIDSSVYYAQGCTSDLDGNIYVAADRINSTGNALLYKFDSNFNMIGTPLELGTHANGIDYDTVLNKIILYSKNSSLIVVNPVTMTIETTTRSVSTNVNYSAVAFSPDFAVFNVTGTYAYVIFNRYGATLNALGIVNTPSAGPHNFRQDSCIVSNTYYQVYSSRDTVSLIRCMSVGGTYAGDFIIDDVITEFEGIYYTDGFYLVDYDFKVYRVNNSLTYAGLVSKAHISSDVKPMYALSGTLSTDTTTIVPVTVNDTTANIMVEAYYDKVHPFLFYRNPFTLSVFNSRIIVVPTTSGAFTVRFQTRHNNLVEISYYAHGTKPLTLYLSNMRYNVGGTEYNLYINQNELTDLETLATKISNFLTTAVNTNNLDITNYQISVLGKTDWVANNPNVYEYLLR